MKIQNHNFLITGASSGIGQHTAIEIARKGGFPILVARREDRLQELALTIEKMFGKRPLYKTCDVTSKSDVQGLFPFVRDNASGLHGLINNAGITAHGRFEDTKLDVARNAMELNFFATAEVTGNLLPLLQSTPGQKMIVYVSTPSSLYGIVERYAYSASKAAGNMLMDAIRMEHGKDQIHTLVFAPGYTETELRTSGLGADGSILKEEQAKGAKSPSDVAQKLIRAIEKNQRIAFTDMNGRAVYYLRTLAPALLEKLILRKTSR